jgi:exonuclease VII small subunit
MQTPELTVDELYDRVETLESRIARMERVITKHEVAEEAYRYREPKVEASREKVDWMKEISEYLGRWERRAIEARHRKSEFEEELAEVKRRIEERTDE